MRLLFAARGLRRRVIALALSGPRRPAQGRVHQTPRAAILGISPVMWARAPAVQRRSAETISRRDPRRSKGASGVRQPPRNDSRLRPPKEKDHAFAGVALNEGEFLMGLHNAGRRRRRQADEAACSASPGRFTLKPGRAANSRKVNALSSIAVSCSTRPACFPHRMITLPLLM